MKNDIKLSENAFESKVEEEIDIPYIPGKITLEKMEQSIKFRQNKLLKMLWNKKTLATGKGTCVTTINFTKHSEHDAEFFLKDFEDFVDCSLTSPDFEENVKSWFEATTCLTSPEEVLYLMYVGETLSKNEALAHKLLEMFVSGPMILYACCKLNEKGIVLKKPG